MRGLRISASAELDLDDIWNYVAAQSGNLETAEKVLDEAGRTFVMLRHTPMAGRLRSEIQPGIRSFAASIYVIYYLVARGQVVISRIIHGNRDQRKAFEEDRDDFDAE